MTLIFIAIIIHKGCFIFYFCIHEIYKLGIRFEILDFKFIIIHKKIAFSSVYPLDVLRYVLIYVYNIRI